MLLDTFLIESRNGKIARGRAVLEKEIDSPTAVSLKQGKARHQTFFLKDCTDFLILPDIETSFFGLSREVDLGVGASF